jgi:hypothetical protein
MKNINKQLVELPDGKYDALWSASNLEILVPKKKSICVETKILIKGINFKTKIKIKDKMITVLA